jgi:hypothetical protein
MRAEWACRMQLAIPEKNSNCSLHKNESSLFKQIIIRWNFSLFSSGISPAKNPPSHCNRKFFMNERKIENHHAISLTVPVEFGTDLPFTFQIKVKPNPAMNTPTIISEKPLIPGLFQIAACADDARSVSALKNALALNRMPLSEMMIDPEKLEAILKKIAQKKKASSQRISVQSFEKTLA